MSARQAAARYLCADAQLATVAAALERDLRRCQQRLPPAPADPAHATRRRLLLALQNHQPRR